MSDYTPGSVHDPQNMLILITAFAFPPHAATVTIPFSGVPVAGLVGGL
jgi:hypothetical protein